MTIRELIDKIDGVILAGDSAKIGAAQAAQVLMFQRVFERGQNAEGAPIGKYSTKDTLVGASSFLTKAGANKILGSKAKRQKLQWVTVEGKRLAVFPEGYKGIRDADGLQTAFVDFLRSGELSRSLEFSITEEGFDLGFNGDLNVKKVKGNESRFGDVFALTQDEIDTITGIYLDEVFKPFN